MKIRDVLNERVARLSPHATMAEAAQLLVLTQSSDIAVIDAEGRLVGVLSEGDLIRAALPDFEEVIASKGSLADAFKLFVASSRELAKEPITRLVIVSPIVLSPDDELLAAATVMIEKQIRRLPVIENGVFRGTVSRADLCWALMARPTFNEGP